MSFLFLLSILEDCFMSSRVRYHNIMPRFQPAPHGNRGVDFHIPD